jgi:hypothetical protein
VRRRYGDEDPIGKEVSDLIERAVSYTVDQFAFDDMMVQTVKHSVLPGRGVPRLRYVPVVTEGGIKDQKTTVETVPWDRFVRGPARSWDRVPWVAFRHDLTQEELAKLGVGKERLETLGFGSSSYIDDDEEGSDDENEISGAQKGIYLTITVYEVWDKAKRQIIFVTPEDKDHVLAVQKDPLGLVDFFPVPKPLQQITRASSLVPVCPYEVYKNLMEEFNRLSVRISGLVGQLKARGIIDKELAVDADAIAKLNDGELAIADGVKAFQQGGGGTLENGIAWWPIDKIVAVLQQLYIQRDQLKQLIYEVTGISDILRGASDARETATAQQIKTQWGSLRLQRLQAEVARVARDLFRMMAEVICKHYEWERIKQMTGLDFAPQMPEGVPPEQMQQAQMAAAQQAQQKEQAVEQLFRDDGTRSFRIDIESDSTIRGDQQRNMEQMNLFLQTTAQFAQAVAGIAQMIPQALPAATEIFVSFARRFRLGKQAEDALESLSEIAKNAGANPQPNPEQVKAEADMQMMQAKAAADQQKLQADIQLKQMDGKLKQVELQLKGLELEIKKVEASMVGRELETKAKAADLEFGHKARMADLDMTIAKRRGDIDIEQAVKQAAVKDETLKIDLRGRRASAEEELRHKRMSADADIDGKLRKSAADRAKEEKAEGEKVKAGPKKIKIERGSDGAIIGGTVG